MSNRDKIQDISLISDSVLHILIYRLGRLSGSSYIQVRQFKNGPVFPGLLGILSSDWRLTVSSQEQWLLEIGSVWRCGVMPVCTHHVTYHVQVSVVVMRVTSAAD